MSADGEGEPGAERSSDPPPFDSMASLRALGDIQRRGLEAANLVVGRLIEQVDRSGPLFGAEPSADGADGARPGPGADLSAMFAQYATLMSSFFRAVFEGQPSSSTSANGSSATAGAVTADPLTLPSAVPGGRSDGELWLHNRSGAAVGDVRVHVSDLRRHDGEAIPSSAVTFDPPHLAELPDLTSRGVRVRVDVPSDTPPGAYRGTILAANLPSVWLVTELEVQDGS